MPVSDAELASLAASHDIIRIGMIADDLRRAHHGTRTTFVRVAAVDADRGSSFAIPRGAGEVRITGTPASRSAAIERIRQIVAAAGDIPLSGFSLVDLERLAVSENITLRALLEDFRSAGLELIAEAPFDRLHDPRRSIEEVNIAGLILARLTVEESRDDDPLALLKLLNAVAALQQSVAVIRAFAPLPRSINPSLPTTGYADVKRLALARIVVEDVSSIQVDWSLYGPKLAQLALTVGADDVDAVSAEDDLSRGPRRSPLEEIRRNIRAAGLEPIERNGRFDVVRRPDGTDLVSSAPSADHSSGESVR